MTPTAITESIVWIATTDELPDVDITVLLFRPNTDEPVWLGYFDQITAHGYIWRSVDGTELDGVTHWAEMPGGPCGT